MQGLSLEPSNAALCTGLADEGRVMAEQVVPGHDVTVRWHTQWRRRCEGKVMREVTGADHIVRIYAPGLLDPPPLTGEQDMMTTFRLGDSAPHGETWYAATVRFTSCGITSRFVPIEVHTPRVSFDAVGKP